MTRVFSNIAMNAILLRCQDKKGVCIYARREWKRAENSESF